MLHTLTIAIDGPVASGKGTLAAALAKKLNALYIYTGAMYRALAYACLLNNINIHREEAVLQFLKTISIELREPMPSEKRTFTVMLNGEDISSKIHDKKIDEAVPVVAAFASIRKEMVALQQKMAEGKSVVMEGRDITTDVLPDANVKIYLTASLEERARRRYMQLKKRGIERPREQIIEAIKERDRQDIERGASPLKIQKNATVIDTTNITIEETIDIVLDMLRKKNLL